MNSMIKNHNGLIYKIIMLLMGGVILLYGGAKIISIYGLFIAILLCLSNQKCQPLFILYIFISTYLIPPFLYFWFGISMAFERIESDINYVICMKILILFFLILYICNRSKNTLDKINKLVKVENRVIFIAACAVAGFITCFGLSYSQNIFESGGYANTTVELLGGLAIWEYFILFILLAYYYSKNIKYSFIIIWLLSVLYCLKGIMCGARVPVIQVMILLFILYFENVFSTLLISICTCFAVFFLGLFAVIRGNIGISLIDSMELLLNKLNLLLANQGDVFYSGTLITRLRTENIYNKWEGLKSLFENFLSIFMPSKFILNEKNDIVLVVSEAFSKSPGGGLISSYFYVWLGCSGVILIAIFLSILFNNRKNNKYITCYLILAIATVPRWFAYKPITLFKLSFYIIPVLFFCEWFHKKTKPKAVIDI